MAFRLDVLDGCGDYNSKARSLTMAALVHMDLLQLSAFFLILKIGW